MKSCAAADCGSILRPGMENGDSSPTEVPLVRMRNISRQFPENGVVANRFVDFDISRGEIHALVGENGSGKSTLMHILSGLILPDSGTIEFGGRPVYFRKPEDALKHGIGIVPQHVQVVRDFSVLENIILGREPRSTWGTIDYAAAKREVGILMDRYNLQMQLDRPAYQLSIDGIQKTALLSLLYHKVDLLVLDEPTSLFEEGQEDLLSTVLHKLHSEGHTLVMITHKLREALSISDRISVMRGGTMIDTYATSGMTREGLSRLMVGESPDISAMPLVMPLADPSGAPGSPSAPDPSGAPGSSSASPKASPNSPVGIDRSAPVLEIEGLSYHGEAYPPLRGINFNVCTGESVAVTGIRENGLETLEQILSGFLNASSGTVRFKNDSLHGLSIRELRKRNIAYIPTERLVRGASMDSSVAENMIILNYRDFHSWGILKKEEIEHFTGTLRHQFNIKAGVGDKLAALSGGNIQRVIISREFSRTPELLIFSEPSWGLDIAGRKFVLQKIGELKKQNSAVLIITSDIEEALESADRIVVMYRGEVSGIVETGKTNKTALGRLMLGVPAHV